jgi:AcrR family transcriptional regulator
MQVSTYMHSTEDRILEAARRAFGRNGVSGATTREIARLAKVNEVTLFRYFKSKNQLLRQVVLKSSLQYEDIFADAPFATPEDLNKTVWMFAEVYMKMLRKKEEFIRTFLGELNRRPKLCRGLFVESSKHVRRKFIDYLGRAQKHGLIRAGLDPVTTADALTGMMLAGVLRRPLTEPEYSNESFTKNCTEIFLRGIQK